MLHLTIVELRKKKKLTQKELAKKLGVTRSALSQYEIGTRNPDYEILQKFAEFFDVSIDFLLGVDTKDSKIRETDLDEERKQLANIIVNINDPEKKKQAFAFLEYLANSPSDGANK